MKRFYTLVTYAPQGEGFAIHLDGKPIRTPARNLLIAPTQALAEAIQGEWAGQEGEVKPESMPLTQILNTRIDKVAAGQRPDLEREVLKFLHTDLLYYRCEDPPEVAKAQGAAWDKWVEWAAEIYGTAPLTTTDLGVLTQPGVLVGALEKDVRALDVDRFTVLQMAVPMTGSLLLGLAFAKGAAEAEDLLRAAFAEEDYKAVFYKADLYGPDPLTQKRRLAMERDLTAAVRYLCCAAK